MQCDARQQIQTALLRGVHPLSPSGFPLRPIDPARQLKGASFSFGKAPLRTTAAFWRDVPRYFIFIVGTPVSRQQKPTDLADSSINASKDRPRPFTRVTAARAGGVAPNKTRHGLKRPLAPSVRAWRSFLSCRPPSQFSPLLACDNTVRSHSLQEKRRSLQSINDWNNANETNTKPKRLKKKNICLAATVFEFSGVAFRCGMEKKV